MTKPYRDHRGRFATKIFEKYSLGETVEFYLNSAWTLGRIVTIDYYDPRLPWMLKKVDATGSTDGSELVFWRGVEKVRKVNYQIHEMPAGPNELFQE